MRGLFFLSVVQYAISGSGSGAAFVRYDSKFHFFEGGGGGQGEVGGGVGEFDGHSF